MGILEIIGKALFHVKEVKDQNYVYDFDCQIAQAKDRIETALRHKKGEDEARDFYK